jgi:hypothetical protein
MAKKVTFTVHDCGCVEIDDPPSSDGWELITVAWACLQAINGVRPNIILQDSEEILLECIGAIKRTHVCSGSDPGFDSNPSKQSN